MQKRTTSTIRRRTIVVAVAAPVFAAGSVAVTTTAARATAPGLVSAAPSPSWQTNGEVDAVVAGGGVVYIGGKFTSVRPPQAAPGTGEVARHGIAAFDAATGNLLTSFNPDVEPFNSSSPPSVQALTLSPDGSTLFIGGDFYTIDGKKRVNVAAYSTATNTLTSWAPPGPNGQVKAITIAPQTGNIYIGGRFTSVQTQARTNVAAYTSSGTLLSWAPILDRGSDSISQDLDDASVHAILVSPDGSEVVLGGAFRDVNGVLHQGIEAVDPTTGTNVAAWGNGPQLSQYFTVFHMVGDANAIYLGGVDNGGRYGINEFDGTAALNWADGTTRWLDNCRGDTAAVTILNGILYTGSHVHDCTGVPNGFGSTLPIYHHLLAESTTDGALQPWWPNTDSGASEGDLGPTNIATDGTSIFLVGTFLTVNNVQPAQGLAIFRPGADVTPPAKPLRPQAAVLSSTSVQLTFTGGADLDDSNLTYSIYRDNAKTPLATMPVTSMPWANPLLTYVDTNVPAGAHTYSIAASDGVNTGFNSSASNSVNPSSPPSSYLSAVQQSGPWAYWRLNEASGATVAGDTTGNGNTGLYAGSLTFGAPGALSTDPDPAVTFDGATGNVASALVNDPQVYTVAAWFKTTTTKGGKIIGFGGRQTGTSGNYDRHIYMKNNGGLIFGVNNNVQKIVITTPTGKAYNDGKWHFVVGTCGPAGMALYVDGALISANSTKQSMHYPGYWRVGGDNLSGWPSAPSSAYFAGSIDEVAIYQYQLTASQISQQYSLAATTPPPPPPPAGKYATAVLQQAPSLYWRLDETAGATAAVDKSGNHFDGTYRSGLTYGVTGALSNDTDTAITGPGSGGAVYAVNSATAPTTYSLEMWFRSTSANGGKLLGFEDVQTGWGTNYDRQIYLTNAGKLVFGTASGGVRSVAETTGSYTDGNWHYVAATQGPDGMSLYVDGALVATNAAATADVYTGFWRVGGGNLTGWPDKPNSSAVAGSFDEVAVYPTELTATQVLAHYQAASG